eukprot:EC689320.1.p1 GENE.EC689320.1~~EC689320.1.p1  ORF type:complete len:131 (+),score=9.27 EC689320.1:69-461(+)
MSCSLLFARDESTGGASCVGPQDGTTPGSPVLALARTFRFGRTATSPSRWPTAWGPSHAHASPCSCAASACLLTPAQPPCPGAPLATRASLTHALHSSRLAGCQVSLCRKNDFWDLTKTADLINHNLYNF